LVDPSTISKIIEKYYDFEGPVKANILSIGINDIYLVETDNKKYVLRLSRSDKYLTMTASEFQFELEWLEFLNQHEVPVSYPIRRLDNQLYGLIQAPEGPCFFTLFSYAEGTTDMNVEQAFILGKTLAQLHMTSDKFKTTLNRNHLSIDNLITHSVITPSPKGEGF
jgi:Ser/Thr protein kinase RdoA (MazF antagonist)